MKKINKILIVLGIIILLTSTFYGVFAEINPDDYKPVDPTVDESKMLTDKVGVILGAVRNISAVVSVITLMIMGLKYMFGSLEEKANYKATMVPYVIGCLMVVAGTTIVSFIYDVFR